MQVMSKEQWVSLKIKTPLMNRETTPEFINIIDMVTTNIQQSVDRVSPYNHHYSD